ncbi:FAD-dependent oxidoreductase [Aurantibacter sp.]|uniref:FAD-dependent oxidoreductase n=1 Tax=Aurantibacter sp. TaxID=2807103 RepID=UPI0035C87B07
MENEKNNWGICQECNGRGKKNMKVHKRNRLAYEIALDEFEKTGQKGTAPIKPIGHLYDCLECSGSGLISTDKITEVDNNYPHVAIIGGGIGGIALAVACLHRGIPFSLFERDSSFDSRSQGYGLTLQQASKAIKGLGLFSLKEGMFSTRHLVHKTDGEVIGEWGFRKWRNPNAQNSTKNTNIHIARQSLRLSFLEQLDNHNSIHWNHQLVDFKEDEKNGVNLNFLVNGETKHTKADLVVGADGIRSTVRKLIINEEVSPLRYLGCIVILGICSLKDLNGLESHLLDSATVFQTANGKERMYMMPYSKDTIMWQLSFLMPEEDAKNLSKKGAKALKEEACKRTQWHSPVPQILTATLESHISGYPVYDRETLKPEHLAKHTKTTLIGDAAHPMSPFKGQGANQAILDALALAREIHNGCKPESNWKENGLQKSVLDKFEAEMLKRSASKVKGSAETVALLHSEKILQKRDGPRGSSSQI